jgi:hypothetical protein
MSDAARQPHVYRRLDQRWVGPLRLCSMCGEALPRTAFRAKVKSSDRLEPACYECDKGRDTLRKREARARARRPVCPHCGGSGRL